MSARMPDKDISHLTRQPGCQIMIFTTLHDTAVRLSDKNIILSYMSARLPDKTIPYLTQQPGCQLRSFHTLYPCHTDLPSSAFTFHFHCSVYSTLSARVLRSPCDPNLITITLSMSSHCALYVLNKLPLHSEHSQCVL